jgi:hypothetical protein
MGKVSEKNLMVEFTANTNRGAWIASAMRTQSDGDA